MGVAFNGKEDTVYGTLLYWAGGVSPFPELGLTALAFNWSTWATNSFPGLTCHMADVERTEVAL